jgi:uncharacterized protein (DUF2147 family)
MWNTGAWLRHAGPWTFAAAATVSLYAGAAVSAGADLGTWLNSERKGKIQLRECGEDGLCGEIVWMKDPVDEKGRPWRDQLNPDPNLRSREVVGIDVIIGAKKIAPMTWQGQIYDPEVGKVYYLKHLKVGREQVEIKGCLPAGWPCRTKYWTRSTPVAQPGPNIQTAGRAPAPKPAPAQQLASPVPAAPPAVAPPPAQAKAPQPPRPPVQARAPQPPQAPPPAVAARPNQPEVTAALPRQSSEQGDGGYLVQVAARQSHNEALQAFNELQRRYPQLLGRHSPEVLRADLGQRGVWYRVGIGPVNQQSAAVDFCQQLKAAGADCLIRRR